MLGPAVAWAAIPLAFSPFGQGPLRGVGWRAEFAWLPASALLSAAMLFRAQRRRSLRVAGPSPGGPGAASAARDAILGARRARNGHGHRARIALATGAIALVLVSLPFVPAVTGIGRHAVRYSYEHRLTPEITGQFVATPRGTVKLFSWRDPQDRYPRDALRLHARDLRTLVVRAAAVDGTDAYRLFEAASGARVPLVVRGRSPTRLVLAPSRPLRVGRYLLVSSHEGMFGGRDFSYLTVVPSAAPATPIVGADRRRAPAVASALLPVATALLALLFCALLARSFRRRAAGEKLLWGTGFALFAVAAASEALAQRAGWSVALFRTYYLAGGVLTVAYLGAGSAWLHLPRRARDALAGALLVATAAAAASVLLAPVHVATLAATPAGRPPANGAVGGHAFLWAVALNSFGTLFLVGGGLYSIARRTRARASAWIVAGALVLALSTSLSRAGDYSFMYLGELLGIALMFWGFQGASTPRARPAAHPSAGALAPAK
jgi:hypothetical protein